MVGPGGPVLVTCANGIPGSEIARRLIESQTKVRAAVHSLKSSDRVNRLPVEVVEVELKDKKTLGGAFSGVERAVSIVPLGPDMCRIASNVVDAAKRAQVRHLVYLSLLNEDIQADNIISKSHRRAEETIANSGIPYTIIRSTLFFQNVVYLYREFIRRGVIVQPSGKASLTLIDLRDVSRVIELVFKEKEHLNKIYSVTNGESYTGSQSAEIFSEILGRKMTYFDRPKFIISKGMKEAGFSQWLIRATSELFADMREGRFDVREDSFTKITGTSPISYRQSIRDYVDYFR